MLTASQVAQELFDPGSTTRQAPPPTYQTDASTYQATPAPAPVSGGVDYQAAPVYDAPPDPYATAPQGGNDTITGYSPGYGAESVGQQQGYGMADPYVTGAPVQHQPAGVDTEVGPISPGAAGVQTLPASGANNWPAIFGVESASAGARDPYAAQRTGPLIDNPAREFAAPSDPYAAGFRPEAVSPNRRGDLPISFHNLGLAGNAPSGLRDTSDIMTMPYQPEVADPDSRFIDSGRMEEAATERHGTQGAGLTTTDALGRLFGLEPTSPIDMRHQVQANVGDWVGDQLGMTGQGLKQDAQELFGDVIGRGGVSMLAGLPRVAEEAAKRLPSPESILNYRGVRDVVGPFGVNVRQAQGMADTGEPLSSPADALLPLLRSAQETVAGLPVTGDEFVDAMNASPTPGFEPAPLPDWWPGRWASRQGQSVGLEAREAVDAYAANGIPIEALAVAGRLPLPTAAEQERLRLLGERAAEAAGTLPQFDASLPAGEGAARDPYTQAESLRVFGREGAVSPYDIPSRFSSEAVSPPTNSISSSAYPVREYPYESNRNRGAFDPPPMLEEDGSPATGRRDRAPGTSGSGSVGDPYTEPSFIDRARGTVTGAVEDVRGRLDGASLPDVVAIDPHTAAELAQAAEEATPARLVSELAAVDPYEVVSGVRGAVSGATDAIAQQVSDLRGQEQRPRTSADQLREYGRDPQEATDPYSGLGSSGRWIGNNPSVIQIEIDPETNRPKATVLDPMQARRVAGVGESRSLTQEDIDKLLADETLGLNPDAAAGLIGQVTILPPEWSAILGTGGNDTLAVEGVTTTDPYVAESSGSGSGGSSRGSGYRRSSGGSSRGYSGGGGYSRGSGGGGGGGGGFDLPEGFGTGGGMFPEGFPFDGDEMSGLFDVFARHFGEERATAMMQGRFGNRFKGRLRSTGKRGKTSRTRSGRRVTTSTAAAPASVSNEAIREDVNATVSKRTRKKGA